MKRNLELYFVTETKGNSVMINANIKGSNKNVGYIIYEYFLKPPTVHDNILIENKTIILKFIEIHDNYKYNGFGTKLMNEFISQFYKQNKVNSIILEARPFNSDIGLPLDILIEFYKKFDFDLIESTHDNYKIMQFNRY